MQRSDTLDTALGLATSEQPHWAVRSVRWLVERFRPDGGWLVLIVCLWLAALPALALGENRLEELRRIQVGLDLIGPLAVFATWVWLGWQRSGQRRGRFSTLLLILALVLTGVLVLSQALVGWLPSARDLVVAIRTNGWLALGQQMVADWNVMVTRFALWWQGVRTGGAAQDNLVFAAMAGAIFWLAGVLLAWLARRSRQGLLAAAPVLWLLGTLLLYSSAGRMLMLGGVLLAVMLHLLLDQERLVRRWQALELDFSPGLFVDRLLAVGSVGLLVMGLAAVLPNWYVDRLVWGYYELIAPIEERLEDFRERLFPELKGTSRLRGGGGLDGLPNEFLLGAGQQLDQSVIMYVRTNDSAGYGDYMGGMPFEQPAPPGHYMRGVTLTHYDGRGWSNPKTTTRLDRSANERWMAAEQPGRKLLVQSISLAVNSSILFGAPEAVEGGVGYDAEVRGDGDLVALWARARNYTVVSAIPAVSEAQLAEVPGWGAEQPLPPAYEIHLELPETITDRTRQLAAQLTAGQPTPFAKASAIEAYLRQYEYDLTVSEPPAAVQDVADYFLFDLRRGYCDYYATAFVVLARLAGLPTRFATGYAAGSWNPVDGVWIITEAEAHSWPEVYFPEYGWIPFEPTAGRPTLARIGLPETSTAAAIPVAPPPAPEVETTAGWNWQMLFWLLPVGLLLWGGWLGFNHWRAQREDPWQGLLRWGQRIGRPLGEGETILEYGRNLAGYLVGQRTREADTSRIAAREVTALSQAVNQLHYATEAERPTAVASALEHWRRLRGYLPRLR
jgi:transglutaminase-like putative cysteine protease